MAQLQEREERRLEGLSHPGGPGRREGAGAEAGMWCQLCSSRQRRPGPRCPGGGWEQTAPAGTRPAIMSVGPGAGVWAHVPSASWATWGLPGMAAVAPSHLTGLVSLSGSGRLSGGRGDRGPHWCEKGVRVWWQGVPALTQEEVLVLVVVRQVFQLLLAVLRREQRP